MLLIDAYNVLHATMPAVLAGLDEAGLCVALKRSAYRLHRAVVVCDGRVKPLGPDASPVDGVDLVYSGSVRSADDVIIERIEGSDAPRRLIVVSTDRQIRAAARKRRCVSVTSDAFVARLAETLDRRPPPPRDAKPQGRLSDDQVQRWLRHFGLEEGD
ncbi:MAG: NYN domain-containing protein [Planctomycetota bacterium]